MSTLITNLVTISGILENEFKERYLGDKSQRYVENTVKVDRGNGKCDLVPIILPEEICKNLTKGTHVEVTGELRSKKRKDRERKPFLFQYVFVKTICEDPYALDKNLVNLRGYICESVQYCKTNEGKEIANLFLKVNRDVEGSNRIRCISWGKNAKRLKNTRKGTCLQILGRIKSSEHEKRYLDDQVLKYNINDISIERFKIVNKVF